MESSMLKIHLYTFFYEIVSIIAEKKIALLKNYITFLLSITKKKARKFMPL